MNRPRLLPLRLARRYASYTLKNYAACKLISDPVYRATADRLGASDLPLFDVGCGIGLCLFYLRAHGYAGPMVGVDLDADKVAAARRVATDHDEQVAFHVGSASDANLVWPEQRGNVVMLDVLHYFDAATQQVVLARMAAAVAAGGWAILRVTPRDAGWRFRCTRAEERFAQAVGWMKAPPVHFPTIEQVTTPFDAAGFTREVCPLWGRTPFNSYLFAFQRPA